MALANSFVLHGELCKWVAAYIESYNLTTKHLD